MEEMSTIEGRKAPKRDLDQWGSSNYVKFKNLASVRFCTWDGETLVTWTREQGTGELSCGN